MRLTLNEIREGTTVVIRGDEAWLEQIYSGFPLVDADGVRPMLTAKLDLRLEAAGSVSVTGVVNYVPRVNCSRCDKVLPWPLRVEVSTRFLPEQLNETPKEKNLSRDDLEVYFLQDDAVDLELLLNDSVQTALPTAYLPVADDERSCRVCHADTAGEQVYAGTTEPEEASPFAVLKGLKLPQ